ncbi:MAG: nickel pincer cofactor biosynthesis protein LarC [Treponema sp.]|nr:nickel pincer cofactor biosynthesis protein LarC [Treponema sp.]
MKNLYIECKMGAAGDMLTAALLELLSEDEKKEALETLKNIGLEGVEFSCQEVIKCGIKGTHVSVLINGEEEESHDHHQEEHEHEETHHHHHNEEHHHHDEIEQHHHEHHHHEHHKLSDIVDTLRTLNISDAVKKDVQAVYTLIAEAESHAHGMPVDQIHFHEVGNKDAIMDITAVCYLMNKIGAQKVIASPVHVGSGQVHCAHGIMPVPAPATEYLLRGIPYYQGEIKGELCTPTGAALLKYFASSFESQPMMKVEKVGIGCGKKDFPAANCVRIFAGEFVSNDYEDKIIKLEANVDDMTGEDIGFAMNRLFEAGAREVFTTAVNMKKNRPGTLISVICTSDKKDEILKTFFKHTTTIGIRLINYERNILKRDISTIQTTLGEVRVKSSSGYEVAKSKYEYDDLERIALENELSLKEVRDIISKEDY